MSIRGGPDIVTDGLVLHLDAAARNKSYPIDGLDVEYLVVAGGGGAAGSRCGGGGAGGLIHGYEQLIISSGTYPITVGAGGPRGSNYGVGARGGDSYLSDLVACSGGGGGSYYTNTATSGGSGGGQGHKCCGIVRASGVEGQGNAGGLGEWHYGGGGGGGAGELGGNGKQTSPNRAGKGGDGLPFDIEGYTKYYSGGGAGGAFSFDSFYYSPGGLGGGATSGGAGETNTGGGGGGLFDWATGNQGNGGSGIVVIRYKGARKATGGDSIYYDKGYTVHVFTSSGNFVVGDRVGGTSTNKVVGELKNMGSSNYKSGNKGYWNLATDEYIDCSDHVDDLIFSSPATISTWLMPLHNKNTGSTFFFIANDVDPVSSTGGYAFIIRYGSTTNCLTGETFVIYRYNGGGTSSLVTLYGVSNGYEYQNQWVNATVVIDNNTWKLYVNGTLQTLTRGTCWTGAQFKYGENISPKDRAFIGTSGANIRLADVKVYNTALTQQQILDNYNASKGRFGL